VPQQTGCGGSGACSSFGGRSTATPRAQLLLFGDGHDDVAHVNQTQAATTTIAISANAQNFSCITTYGLALASEPAGHEGRHCAWSALLSLLPLCAARRWTSSLGCSPVRLSFMSRLPAPPTVRAGRRPKPYQQSNKAARQFVHQQQATARDPAKQWHVICH
jgi:hypothetical protein